MCEILDKLIMPKEDKVSPLFLQLVVSDSSITQLSLSWLDTTDYV